ncbi:RNA-dependent RNA polymerase [Orthohantavirus robinaense]|uniref:RNA-directed RNA polymerase L n=1 Tax=Orthohantavirus robinaense TaxID=3052494 RepID=A0A5Q5APZ7_9VIRU|nr:RNA-dependent RNA polymerase [Orthohantavirus robinaense]QED22046.1 RNA-dependent RNA polymerase [Orthohantavirus robinaense]
MNRYYVLEREIREKVPGTVSAIECIDLLDKLYAVRHDIIDEMIKHDWADNKEGETPILTVLLQLGIPENLITKIEKVVIPNHPTGKTLKQFFKMTPDNYKIEGNTCYFKEVTVTSDVDKGIREKKRKYLDGFNQLQVELDKAFKSGGLRNRIEIVFDVVSVKMDGSNISTQWPSARAPGAVQHMRLVQALISFVREHLISDEEKGSLEAMFNLKFNISEPAYDKFKIPEFPGLSSVNPSLEELVDHCKNWLSKEHQFSFDEVTGELVLNSFEKFEKEQKEMFPHSRKPRNFLLVQAAIDSEYSPSTIMTDQYDTRYAVQTMLRETPSTPVQTLVRDMCHEFVSLDQDDLASYYANKSTFIRTQRVHEPGTFKIGMSRLTDDSKKCLDIISGSMNQTKLGEIESLYPASSADVNEASQIVEKILSDLCISLDLGQGTFKSRPPNTYVDRVLNKFNEGEIDKFLVRPLRKTVCWHIAHLLRDITESLIAHSGLKRSKFYSVHAYHKSSVLLCILPSKSLEASGSYVRFITVFKDAFGLVDRDNLDSIQEIDGVRWCYSKVISLDLNRLLSINNSFEKSFIATAVWFQYYVEDQSHFPFQAAVRSVFSYHFLLAVTQKMKVCALFDNARYLIPSSTALYSGVCSLIERFSKRHFKTCIELYLYMQIRKLLVLLAQNNKLRFFSKVRLLGLTVDQSSIGASGVYPSLISPVVYKHYKSVISEVTTCFFMFEKGLHGTMTEEAKVHMETVEWAQKFYEKEEKYGIDEVKRGYRLSQVGKDIVVEQQLYCQDVVELAANELNVILTSKTQVLASSILQKHWEKQYFSQPRNISLKAMSGAVQEDGHLAASVTMIEAIRYLSTHRNNPTVIELYQETRHIPAQARIVRKHQRTEADRGFFITTLPTRARLEIIEDYFDAISKHVSEEYISYGGEKKILSVQVALEKALRWASGKSSITLSTGKQLMFKRKLMYVSADATKWSPGDNSAKFQLFTAILHNGLRDNLLRNCVIDALRNMYETEFFMSRRLRGYIEKMDIKSDDIKQFLSFFSEEGGRSGKVRGNWLQGNLNKCSSLFGVAVSFLFKRVWQELFTELNCFIEVAHHSDDALFIYGYLEPEDDGSDWFLFVTQKIQAGELHWHAVNTDMWKAMFNLHEYILLMGSIKISPKKTTVSPTNAEFLSTFFEGCSVSVPFSKILLGALSDLPGLGFFDDLAAGQSRCVKALDMGASPQVAQLALSVVNSKVERLYGTAPGMINSPLMHLSVQPDEIPIPLGGLGSNSVLELATAGIGMADKNNLRKALITFRHKNRGRVSYHLGLFKYLMSLSNEVFNHERLGEFSFTGKVQWKIFTPKSEFEFHDMYSKQLIKRWSDEHPAYDYIIPTTRDHLLVYLVRKLNEPSITAALTVQSPIQLRFRMQAKQHLPVCKCGDEWVTFRQILASAHLFAQKYEPTQEDLDLFNTLAECTFSKEFAWQNFLNGVDCEVLQSRKIARPKVARTFTVKERDQNIQNQVSVVIAYRFATTAQEIKDVLAQSRFPESLPSDLKILHDGVYRELGLDTNDSRVMKKIAPLLYKSGRSRVVIVQGNVEGTAETICSYWLKQMSFVKQIKVIPHREVLQAVSIFNVKETSGDRLDLAAIRLCIEVWRWAKHNELNLQSWFHNLWFEDRTLFDWLQKFQRKGFPIVDPEIQCAGLMVYDVFGNMSVLQVQANRRAYSGKQYDADCHQTYNELSGIYEGDLRVVFNFGVDCARLEVFWDKKEYLLETSVTSRHVLKLMMEEVTKELLRCGMRFKTEQVTRTNALVLFKTDSGFEWGKPNMPCIVFRNCMLRTGLRTQHSIKSEFKITVLENGFKAIAQLDDESPRFLLAHAYHTLKDIRYQALDAVGPVYFQNLYMNPIIQTGLIENFMKGLPAVIPPNAYSLIMNKAKISVDLFMFNKLLALINPDNVLDLSGLEAVEGSGYSTVTSISSTDWAAEMDLMDDDIDLDDEFTMDLNELDFDEVDTSEDMRHFLQDESSYTADLLISAEPKEVKKLRGLIKVLKPIELIKSWVSKGMAVEKLYNPIGIVLMARYLSKNYWFGQRPVNLMDPYDLTEFEAIVRGWGELVCDNFNLIDKDAREFVEKNNCLPEDVAPDSLFTFRHTKVLMDRLFHIDRSKSFY